MNTRTYNALRKVAGVDPDSPAAILSHLRLEHLLPWSKPSVPQEVPSFSSGKRKRTGGMFDNAAHNYYGEMAAKSNEMLRRYGVGLYADPIQAPKTVSARSANPFTAIRDYGFDIARFGR